MRIKLLEASDKMLLALKVKNIPDLKERLEEFELAIVEEKIHLAESKRVDCNSELNNLGKRKVELCNIIDVRRTEQEKIRGRSKK